jgi:hypothetical protein
LKKLCSLIKAVDTPYLAALRDRASNSFQGPVYQVIDHLLTVYGRVSPQMLENREQELQTMLYNAKFPIDIVFKMQSRTLSTLQCLDNNPSCKDKPSLKLTLLSTKQAVSSKPSWNGIKSLTCKRPGSTSKPIFDKPIKNSEKLLM